MSEQTTPELTRKSTRWIASLPGMTEAVTGTVDLRFTTLLFAGLVIEICGSTRASIMIGTGIDVPVFPAASLAVAWRECAPADVAPVFHEIV